jgi:hypothetical protein
MGWLLSRGDADAADGERDFAEAVVVEIKSYWSLERAGRLYSDVAHISLCCSRFNLDLLLGLWTHATVCEATLAHPDDMPRLLIRIVDLECDIVTADEDFAEF